MKKIDKNLHLIDQKFLYIFYHLNPYVKYPRQMALFDKIGEMTDKEKWDELGFMIKQKIKRHPGKCPSCKELENHILEKILEFREKNNKWPTCNDLKKNGLPHINRWLYSIGITDNECDNHEKYKKIRKEAEKIYYND